MTADVPTTLCPQCLAPHRIDTYCATPECAGAARMRLITGNPERAKVPGTATASSNVCRECHRENPGGNPWSRCSDCFAADAELPQRAYRLVLDMQADDIAEMCCALDNISIDLEREPRTDGASITSGGYGAGWHLEITHNDGQTHRGYANQLTKWIDARRAENGQRP